jgi:tetratricopeptide (TPR) repeat protein
LLRQYATEQLQEDAEARDVTQKIHARYYADFMQQCEIEIRGHRQLETYTRIAADIDNIRTSWRWAVEKQDLEIFEKSQNALTDFYEEQGHFQEGEAALRRAVAALHRPETVLAEPLTERQATVLGTLLDNQAWFTFRLGLPEAIKLWQQSIAVLRQAGAGGRWELAGALSLLGGYIGFYEDYAQGDGLLQESLVLATEVEDQYLLGFVRLILGQTAQYQGEYRAALPHLQQSINYFEQIGERRFRSFVLNSWGRAAYGMGQYAQVEELLMEALEIRRAIGDHIGIAYSLLDLGRLAKAQGHLTKANQQMQASLAICEEIGARPVMAWCLNWMGNVARLQGEFERAEELLQKSLVLFKEIKYAGQLPLCLNNLAHLAYDQGAYGQAEQYLQESLAICQQTMHSGEMASALRYLGHVAVAVGDADYSEIQQYFRKALEIVTRTGAAPVALDVLLGWAMLLMGDEPGQAERVQAVELLTLVQYHSASQYETKEKTNRLLAGWISALPLEVAKAAQFRGETFDLWETATELLEEV